MYYEIEEKFNESVDESIRWVSKVDGVVGFYEYFGVDGIV